jgi:hypothetical protein
MRYLFGDSTPFPLPFDFLRTLEAFMMAGTRVVLLEHRTRKLAHDRLVEHGARAEGVETLERFHDSVLRSMNAAAVPQHAYAVDYARRLAESATSLVSEQRREVEQARERDAARIADERASTNEEVAGHLRTFFRTARLPTLDTRLTTTLVDGRPDASALLAHPGGVGVSFTLSTSKAASWNAPRKLSELAGHLELMVGIKKSWLGGKVSREPVRLDDWVIGWAELGDSGAKIALRRKVDQKDTLVFELRRDLGALSAQVTHPGDPNAELLSSAAEPADLPHLERLWTALRATFDDILEERASITGITLDGADAIASGLGQELVERLVTVLAPTALEVARRSPNARELSLKREGSDGRREEFYLKRDQLIETLQPLPREGRAVFAPLGLDGWVPVATVRPPAVTLGDSREELTSLDLEEA